MRRDSGYSGERRRKERILPPACRRGLRAANRVQRLTGAANASEVRVLSDLFVPSGMEAHRGPPARLDDAQCPFAAETVQFLRTIPLILRNRALALS